MIQAMLMSNAVMPVPGPFSVVPVASPTQSDRPSFGHELQRAAERSSSEPRTDEGAADGKPAATPVPARTAAPSDRARTERKPAQAAERRGADEQAARKSAHDPAEAADSVADDPAAEDLDAVGGDDAAPPPDLSAFVASLTGRAQVTREAASVVPRRGKADDLHGLETGAGTLPNGAGSEVLRTLVQDRNRALRPGAASNAADAAESAGTTTIAPAADGSPFATALAEVSGAGRSGPAHELARVEPAQVAQATPAIERAQVSAAANATTPVIAATLAEPLGSPDFAQALGARVAVFARDGIEHARLNIHPAEMGPIAVQIALDGTQLRVDFRAEVATTRQALEQSLPALASALSEAGLTLSGGGVFQHAREGSGDARPGGTATPGRGMGGSPREPGGPGEATLVTRPVRLDGLVDLYA